MPNWCYTKLTIEGEAASIAALKAASFTDGQFDFNQVIPMPSALDIEAGSLGHIGYDVLAGNWRKVAAYPWVLAEGPFNCRAKLIRHFEGLDAKEESEESRYLVHGWRYIANEDKYGFQTWYDWSNHHWGTKWNVGHWDADGFVDEACALVMRFDTAWSPALPILVALAARYPVLSFELVYADEGGGFAGIATAQGDHFEYSERPWEAVMENQFGFSATDD